MAFVIKLQQSSHNLELLGGDGDLRSMRKQVTDGKLSGRSTHPSFRGCKRRLQHVPLSKRCAILGKKTWVLLQILVTHRGQAGQNRPPKPRRKILARGGVEPSHSNEGKN